jgi:tetratricopeptide (TPR) repeat protein
VRDDYPDDHWVWHQVAALLVADGQLDAYREQCRKSAERFGKTADPSVAERVAKDCLILPESGADLGIIAKMADTAAAGPNGSETPWFQLAKGMAEYRLRRFTSAVEWLNQALNNAGNQTGDIKDDLFVQNYMVLAMAHYQLKHTDAARAAFAKGAEIERKKLPKLESGDIGGNWLDWIIAHSLMREAKALIEGAPETKAEAK